MNEFTRLHSSKIRSKQEFFTFKNNWFPIRQFVFSSPFSFYVDVTVWWASIRRSLYQSAFIYRFWSRRTPSCLKVLWRPADGRWSSIGFRIVTSRKTGHWFRSSLSCCYCVRSMCHDYRATQRRSLSKDCRARMTIIVRTIFFRVFFKKNFMIAEQFW